MARNALVRRAVGTAIRSLREARGWSQEDLADRAGVHRTYVGGIERGERNPSVEAVHRLLGALDTDWARFGREVHGRL